MGSLQGAPRVCCLLLAVRIKGRDMYGGQTQSHTGQRGEEVGRDLRPVSSNVLLSQRELEARINT